MELLELYDVKIAAMIGLGLSSMCVGLLPAWFSSRARHQYPLFLSLLICFGGGVLMATSLVHMLPEIREMLLTQQQNAELLLCGGFFLVYIVDEVVHFFYSEPHGHSHNGHSHQNGNPNVTNTRGHSVGYQVPPNYGSNEHDPLLCREHNRTLPTNPNYSGVLLMQEQNMYNDVPPSQLCHVGHQEPCDASPIGKVGLLLALSVHSVLEGLAVGLQRSTSKVLLILVAIACHKLVIGFCLGVELASSPVTSVCRHFICITIFSFGSVVGIGVGMVVHEISKDILEIVFPISQGLAAGTLLYITVSEILPRERARWHKHHDRRVAGILQLVFVVGGFISMVAIKIFLAGITRYNRSPDVTALDYL